MLSISLFEAVVILLLPYTFYRIYKLRVYGSLFPPLLIHAFAVLLSTLLYFPSQIGKAVERGLFLLLYPLGGMWKVSHHTLYRLNLLLVWAGLLLLPVVFYRFYKTGQPAMLWGGWFEVGAFYTLFALSAVSLLLFSRRWFYILPLLTFTITVFFTMRRSAMLGFAFALLALLYLLRRRLSFKFRMSLLFLVVLAFTVSTYLLVHKDPRYATFWQVLTGRQALTEEALNTISSLRWQIAKAGIEVLSKDVKEGHILPLLIGHGINSGLYLEPKSPTGGVYESVFILSELIEKGLVGLVAVLWVFIAYFRFLLRFKVENQKDYLLLPFLLMLGVHLVGSVFTFFWDAMLPLYLVYFRLAEAFSSSQAGGGHDPQAP